MRMDSMKCIEKGAFSTFTEVIFDEMANYEYKCSGCGREACKLWREVYGDAHNLRCAECLSVKPDSQGYAYSRVFMCRNLMLDGGWIPAVTTPDMSVMFQFAMIPPDRLLAWQKLPLH
jgi:DNA-directed RNA polymerase subunit RPC12/RpoP